MFIWKGIINEGKSRRPYTSMQLIMQRRWGSNKILNLEKGYDLDPVWSGFNEEYRNIIAKKIGVTKK